MLDYLGAPQLPIALVGWSMGGAVVIEAAANAIKRREVIALRGVATIASMKEVSLDSPRILVDAEIKLLLMHNLTQQCRALNSRKIAQLAGGKIAPVLFPGEDHAVESAFDYLSSWLPALF